MPQSNTTISQFDENSIAALDQDKGGNGAVYGYQYLVICPICLFLVLFNSLLIYIIISNKKKAWVRRTNHIFYLILCDLIVGVTLSLSITVRLIRLSRKPYWLCASLSYNMMSTQAASYYHMLAVCIHRFRKLRKVDVPNGIDKYRYGLESFMIWIVVLLASLPPYAFSWDNGHYLDHCRSDFIFGHSDKSDIIYMYFLTMFCLPCLLTNTIYAVMICRMKIQLVAVRPANLIVRFKNTRDPDAQNTTDAAVSIAIPQSTSGTGMGIGQTSNRVNRIIGYLLVVLNISILSPTIMFGMLLGGHKTVPLWIQALTYINNIACPFIYSFTIAPLRNELKITLRTWFSRLRSVIH